LRRPCALSHSLVKYDCEGKQETAASGSVISQPNWHMGT
jgi:hypothetical protein